MVYWFIIALLYSAIAYLAICFYLIGKWLVEGYFESTYCFTKYVGGVHTRRVVFPPSKYCSKTKDFDVEFWSVSLKRVAFWWPIAFLPFLIYSAILHKTTKKIKETIAKQNGVL